VCYYLHAQLNIVLHWVPTGTFHWLMHKLVQWLWSRYTRLWLLTNHDLIVPRRTCGHVSDDEGAARWAKRASALWDQSSTGPVRAVLDYWRKRYHGRWGHDHRRLLVSVHGQFDLPLYDVIETNTITFWPGAPLPVAIILDLHVSFAKYSVVYVYKIP